MIALILALAAGAKAQEQDAAALGEDDGIERILVIGSKEAASEIAGSATYISAEDLATFEYADINRILRLAPGVNIQEEDGFGLRPNIGLRGTSVDRSEKVTLMEDGVLIAPAPYAAPAAYYFPTAGRLSGVEVRKGSSAIKFGPRTVGGAINLLSTAVPEELSGKLEARFGSDGLYQVHGFAGGMVGQFGGLLETYQSGSDGFKKLDGGGDTGFEIEDYVAKLRFDSGDQAARHQTLELKLSLTDQQSNETYLGLTDDDFAVAPFRRYAASQNDKFDSEHKQVQLTHHIDFTGWDVTTVAYYNAFERDWFKFDRYVPIGATSEISPSTVFRNPGAFAADLEIFRGNADSADDAIQLRHNAREYYSWGVQSVLGTEFELGSALHEVEFSVRYHEDEEDRLQNEENFAMRSGVLVPTSVDPIGSQANRVNNAEAWAFFVQDRIEWDRLTIVPGVRVEAIDLARRDFSTADPDRSEGPTRLRENSLTAVIPGIGVTYDVSDEVMLLAGVHRGFSPPTPGGPEEEEEEDSINYEAGFRYDGGVGYFELIGFYNDYDNLLGSCTASSGTGTCDIGDQFNGGQVDVLGLEIAGGMDFALTDVWRVPLRFNYTYTDAEFQEQFDSDFFGDVVPGDALPYIPNHQGYASIGVASDRAELVLSANYIGEIRTEPGQGPIPQLERLESHIVFDLAGHFDLARNVRAFGSVQNLFDEVYGAARRPYGLRPGKPRTFIAGLGVAF